MAKETSLPKVRPCNSNIHEGRAGGQRYRGNKVSSIQRKALSVPKEDTGKRRVIFDISVLNKSISCPKFKMTSVSQVRRVLPQDSWAVSIGLKDAYWDVCIESSFKKFLSFSIEGRKYQFRAMPFGFNIDPLAFTRLTKVIPKELRVKGVQVLVYLDDWLLWARAKRPGKSPWR